MCFAPVFDLSNMGPDRSAVKHFLAVRLTFLGVHRDGEADHGADNCSGRQGVDDVREDGHVLTPLLCERVARGTCQLLLRWRKSNGRLRRARL